MTGKEAWSIIAPFLGSYMESNPVTLEAYGITFLALSKYDSYTMEKITESEAIEWEAEESERMCLGDRIKEALSASGMSQRELADKCHITEVSLSRYIRSERMPKASVLKDISDALGVSTDYLIKGENNR